MFFWSHINYAQLCHAPLLGSARAALQTMFFGYISTSTDWVYTDLTQLNSLQSVGTRVTFYADLPQRRNLIHYTNLQHRFEMVLEQNGFVVATNKRPHQLTQLCFDEVTLLFLNTSQWEPPPTPTTSTSTTPTLLRCSCPCLSLGLFGKVG